MAQTLAGKRVVVVCAHFSPEIGYQEVDLARAFTRMKAQVRVVTSTRLSPNAQALVSSEYQPGVAHTEGYEVVRLEPRLTIGPNVLGCSVRRPVEEFGPDFVILVGPGKLFGIELFSSTPSAWRRIAVLQDNSEDGRSRMANGRGRRRRAIAHRLVKRRAYRKVVRYADRIVLNVPETREMIEPWLTVHERHRLDATALELRLGFDPERFFFDREARRTWRARYGIDERELLLATCTRAVPSKALENVIDVVSALRESGLPVRYALGGLMDDDYGRLLRARALVQPDPKAFLLLSGLTHGEMRELFSAADLGFWPRTAITIQQAMGTGLPVVLRRRPAVSHLLASERSGWYIRADESLDSGISRAVKALIAQSADERLEEREEVAELNRTYLSYDSIAGAMVEGLDHRGTPDRN